MVRMSQAATGGAPSFTCTMQFASFFFPSLVVDLNFRVCGVTEIRCATCQVGTHVQRQCCRCMIALTFVVITLLLV